jgi:hypothetical protein
MPKSVLGRRRWIGDWCGCWRRVEEVKKEGEPESEIDLGWFQVVGLSTDV